MNAVEGWNEWVGGCMSREKFRLISLPVFPNASRFLHRNSWPVTVFARPEGEIMPRLFTWEKAAVVKRTQRATETDTPRIIDGIDDLNGGERPEHERSPNRDVVVHDAKHRLCAHRPINL